VLERPLQLAEAVVEVVRALVPDPHRSVDLGDHLVDDLEFESFGLVELAYALEELFGIDEIEADELGAIECVSDVVSFVERNTQQLGEIAPSALAAVLRPRM
jgi:acyl carrier protein